MIFGLRYLPVAMQPAAPGSRGEPAIAGRVQRRVSRYLCADTYILSLCRHRELFMETRRESED